MLNTKAVCVGLLTAFAVSNSAAAIAKDVWVGCTYLGRQNDNHNRVIAVIGAVSRVYAASYDERSMGELTFEAQETKPWRSYVSARFGGDLVGTGLCGTFESRDKANQKLNEMMAYWKTLRAGPKKDIAVQVIQTDFAG